MMVVMLIMSIIMAAMAPVMTRRAKTDTSSPWKWSSLGSPHAYFGVNDSQTALIGQKEPAGSDPANKLTINAPSDTTHILFKSSNNTLARLFFKDNAILFGTLSSNNGLMGKISVGIGNNISTGDRSVAIGNSATSSAESVAIGNSATSSANSVAIGRGAVAQGGYVSVAIGGQDTKAASDAVAIAGNAESLSIAIRGDAYGKSSVAIRGQTGIPISSGGWNGDYSIAIGKGAMATNFAGIAIGYEAIARGMRAIAIGNEAMKDATGVSIGIGYRALQYTSAGGNVAIGEEALWFDESGGNNVAIGNLALLHNDSGNSNIAIGKSSLTDNTTGSENMAIGYGALYKNTTGGNNIAIGQYSLSGNQTGSNNIAIGQRACQYVTGSNKVCIGANSGPASSETVAISDEKMIFLGDSETTVYIPGRLVVGGEAYIGNALKHDYSLYLGMDREGESDIKMRRMHMHGRVSTDNDNYSLYRDEDVEPYSISDRRLKYVGAENKDGLAKLRQLKVFNYTFKKDEKKTPHVGVIAQDLQKVFPKAVKKGEDGFLSIRMEDMFYAVINAIKELDAKVTTLINCVQQLQKETKQLRAENKELKKRLEALEKAK